MNTQIHRHAMFSAICLTAMSVFAPSVQAAPPDLTAAGAIAALKTNTSATPVYSLTYNLGPTGLRGWIWIDRNNMGADGLQTAQSRQILVTVASAPANVALQVDDLILGAMAADSGEVPLFTSDARKAFGTAIGEAEKTGAGTLRVKRWRAGTTTDENIPMTIMGDYSATAPYSCPKSALILANARNKLVGQLKANSNFLTNDWKGAVSGLALLAGVAPGDPDYSTVQTRLQTYARPLSTAGPVDTGLSIWNWGYLGVFLAEYYLATGDANVLPGISQYSLKLAQTQSMYGTFGHGPALPRPDGTGRMSVAGYGPVNSTGLPANLAMVMGRKALVAGAQPIDPQIDAAIQRASDFFSWYVNKGSIPYGEHHPGATGHASNGKDQTAAIFFAQQDNRLAETEYFTRMCVAGFAGREYGHTGQGFSYLWEGMATHVGGQLAVAEYLKPVRWHLDLSRRTDGSFAYDGGEQYDAGKTSDGTYLGASGYYDLNPTACYLLTYSLPLQRLHITGKNANPAHELDSTKVANAIAAATYKFDRAGRTTTQLIGDLSEFDPVVRNFAAIELSIRTLTPTELATLRTMLGGSNANGRMGACQALGLLKDPTAMPLITQRLDKTIETDPWVRATAATALRDYGTNANSQVNTMLARFADNAADPDTIVWSDPLQASNGKLAWALFDSEPGTSYFDFGATTISAAKNLLYPAVSSGFKHPDSAARQAPAYFAFSRMPIGDVQAMPNDFINLIRSETQVDRMWSSSGRQQGIRLLSKYKFFETMPLGLSLLDVPTGFEHGSSGYVDQALSEIATYGDAARWTLPTLRSYLHTWDPGSSTHTALVKAIATIEAAATSPASPAISYLKAAANGQVVTTSSGNAKAITLTGSSCRQPSVSFAVLTQPYNGTLTGTAPNLTYTPNPGYTGPDHFTFGTADTLTTSEPATVGVVVGTAGTGLKGEYFDNADFSNPKLTRTDAQVNFDWGTGSPTASLGADTFSVKWSGQLLVPETCAYTFSALSNDGVRLYLNGVCLIDNFLDQNSKWTDSAPIQLTKGQMVEIQMEYYENTASAAAKLKWTGPSVAGQAGAIIPQAYLFDGGGIADRTPYAHAQTVSTLLNTAKAITLTGSSGTLTYAVLTQPANGTLTGTAPYLTYTPAANFSGTDGFTFLVNNGAGNSSPATVSIAVAVALPVTTTWASAVSANMSAGASWVGGNAPPAAGLPYCNLNFAPTGTYTATHDLNNGFKLNQLNFSGAVTIAGTNTLSFAANGGALPQLNQNSTNAVTVNPPLELAATTTLGGSYGGNVTLGSLISGSGGLVKTSSGTLQINNSNNTYTGGTILNNGTVTFPGGNGSITPHFGTGPITINANVNLAVNRTILSNAMTLNGCTISGGNSFASVLSGPVTLAGITTVDFRGGFQISGNVSGAGGITTVGTSQWTMNGTNSYTGPTTIQAGTLRYQAAAAVGPGAIIIAAGGKANLNYTGNRVIASLSLGGIAMPPGSYGGSASAATFKNDSYFTSTSVGTVTVLPPTNTTLVLTGGSTPANPGTALTFTATVTGSTPTGSVAFYDGATLLGNGTLNGSFQASFITSSLAIGVHSITARYAGNTTNATSTSAAVPVEIFSLLPPAPTNLVAAAGSNHVGLTWTLSTGATSYYVKRATASGGPYTVIGNPSAASYDDVTAVNGTTYYYFVSALNAAGESANSNMVSGTPALVPSTTDLVSSPVATGPYGTAVTFTATVTASGGPATGTVTFKDGGTVLGIGALSAGTAAFTTSTLAAANHSITATYGGDATFASSVSAPTVYVVTPISLAITGVTAANKIYDGTATATLTGGTLSGGVVGSETVTVIPGSGAFASANAGTWAVTASGYVLGGAHAGNYALSAQPAVPDATIAPRPVQLTGTRAYDATALAAAAGLTISNKVGGDDLTLTGTASLAAKDAGTRAILPPSARVQSATGSTGASANAALTANLAASPVAGNTLIAVISTRGSASGRVLSISQTGVANWAKASGAEGVNTTASNSSTTEIWFASNVPAGAGATVTVNLATPLFASAVVAEYGGVLTASPLDQTANSSGNDAVASTGTTNTTTQATELWIGGIGLNSSTPTLGTPLNGFTSIASAQSTGSVADSNARVHAMEKISNAAGTASSGGTITGATGGAITQRGSATTGTTTGTTLTINKPAGVIAGDVMLATVAQLGNNSTDPALAGWTLVDGRSLGGTNARRGAVLYRVADGAEGSSFAFTLGSGVSSAVGDIIAFAGVNATGGFKADGTAGGPFDVDPGTISVSSDSTTQTVTATAIVTSSANAAVVMLGMAAYTAPTWNSAGWSAASAGSLTELFDHQGSAASVGGAWLIKATAGSTGAGSATLSAAQRNGGLLVALRPVTAAPRWSGAIATFRAVATGSLALNGSASPNYTLTGLTGAVEITPTALTITADNQGKIHGQTLAFGSGATQFTSSALQSGETIGSVTLTCAGGEAAAGVALYPITPSSATGGSFSATNYAIDYVPGVLTVSPAATTTMLTTSGSPVPYGIPVTLTATVVPAPGGGTVQFHDHAVALGSPVPLSGGQAQVVTGSLAAGSHSITATYSGSANFTGSTAAAMTQTVEKAMPAITTPPSATEITSGQTLASSTLSGGAASVPGTFAFTAPATAPPVGTAAQSVTFTPADADNYQTATTSVSVTVNPAQTPFEAWADDPAQGLISGVNDGPLDDPDHDGFSNLVEFVLGGTPMLSSQAIQPKLTHPGGNWVFSYDRTHLSKSSTIQVVEYGNDLTGWTPLAIPAESAGDVNITPGASSDHVKVTIPNPGSQVFVRLKVSQ